MPSYFYHLKFDLYPYPSTEAEGISAITTVSTRQRLTKEQDEERRRQVFLPPLGADIFETEDWPAHEPVQSEAIVRAGSGQYNSASQDISARTKGSDSTQSLVIDCGAQAARGPSPSSDRSEDFTRVSSELVREFPPPSPGNIRTDLQTAVKDWRFGRVRIEGLDMMERPRHKRGESSSHVGGNGINAGLAPEVAGSQGRVTKARFEAVEQVGGPKNTEVGWGVVHLYRDGEPSSQGLAEELYDAKEGEGDEVVDGDADDCTTLCIPAVPSYLTTNDFLGFVGEKTREEVSHIRMVMTGRMNRYLVLMKFRDAGVARRWRKEWDGKVFNTMEVKSSTPYVQEEV